MNDGAPEIAVNEVSRKSGASAGFWLFGWRIENRTDQPLTLLAARLPHGKFRSGERRFDAGLQAARGQSVMLEMDAFCAEDPGTVIENAFVLLYVEWSGARWRIFVRLRVSIDSRGEPNTSTELITNQRVGFSGVAET